MRISRSDRLDYLEMGYSETDVDYICSRTSANSVSCRINSRKTTIKELKQYLTREKLLEALGDAVFKGTQVIPLADGQVIQVGVCTGQTKAF